MKKSMKHFAVVILTLCLTLANLIPAAAATTTADNTIPTVAEVTTEAQKTAAYLMKGNLDTKLYDSMSDTTSFKQASRNLFFAIRSGLDCNTNIKAYTSSLNKYLNSDGTLKIDNYGFPDDIIGCQSYLIQILLAGGYNPENFNNMNLIDGLSSMINNKTSFDFTYASDPVTYLGTAGINPYYLGILYTTVSNYENVIANSTSILNGIRTTLTAVSDNNGVDYYGYSMDNNGSVFPGFSSLYDVDTTFKTLINSTLAYNEKNNFDIATGKATTTFSDWQTGELVTADSCSSTALAIAFYGSYSKSSLAAASYHALLTYTSKTNSGVFTDSYGSDDLNYSTPDALVGLVSYQYALSGINNVYDTTKKLPSKEPASITISTPDATPAISSVALSTDASFVDANGNALTSSDIRLETSIASQETINKIIEAFTHNDLSYSNTENIEFYNFSLTNTLGNIVKIKNGNVQITFSYKDGFDMSKYDVFVYHLKDNGELESLNVTSNEDSFSIEASSFSPYAVVYVEKADASPSTGDATNTVIYAMILVAAMAAMGVCVKKRNTYAD